MSDNTIRIRTTPNGNDKYLKVKLEQEFDFIEILSLKISQEDAYRNFCSDYGVVAGRVIINSGFGVPNAKVSIFIPIDDVDRNNPEILGLYPYEVITDKDTDGVRYNLLPKTSETENECFTPIGTFPNKREILDNPELTEVYCKYYKFTTTTNSAGDFMIFGVPLGNHTVHVDVDISDIGIASQRPYDSITQGATLKMFDSPTKFKGGTNLDKLVQVKSANVGVNVQPFWGNKETCEIGITRLDIDLNYTIRPSAIFMGSIFGDQEKNSVNKRCIPRRDMGKLCDQATNEGTIEMIRKTIDGSIERFDIEGGRVIDENGAWAYQIPMNLDYMVTDEFGNLVLSDDQNKGIPTKASVRFKVGMDETGNEGRLRTRAKYLVPHNPNNENEIDYEFGEKTKESSFRDLYWNKIYSVSNYISRFQTNSSVGGRKFMGIKDVDECVGNKTPFPFNKINTNFNPIFFIICLIIKIIGFIIWLINSLIIPLINLVISIVNVLIEAWNSLMRPLCKASKKRILRVRIFGFLGFTCKLIIPKVKYIPCLYVNCPADNGLIYAPGCSGGGLDGGKAKDALVDQKGISNVCPGGGLLCGLDDCVAAEMAQALNIFQYDFYNDWINGTLYSFLLKYKRRRRKSEKFCEYDCSDFGISSGGVDGNGNGEPDNRCRTNALMDVCFDGGNNSQNEGKKISIREGLIKKIGDEFYYAASTHNGSVKLFATDIINLGSVFKCDWQGVPKIQEFLIPTSYTIPPTTPELDDAQNVVIETGQVAIGNIDGLFFDIDCLGAHSSFRQCLNIRHMCEFGVETDQNRIEEGGPATDAIIGLADLDTDDGDRPKWFRDVFLGLNKTINTWDLNYPFSSSFNLQNLGVYNFTSPIQNGVDYVNFRGYSLGGTPRQQNEFGQFKNSFYFYFGLNPGKTGLDKMNQSFFTICSPKIDLEFNIVVNTTPVTVLNTATGTAVISTVGGNLPISINISGPNGYSFVGVIDSTTPTINLSNLVSGTYIIVANDSIGSPITQTFNIGQPIALFAEAFVSQTVTSATAPNGQITISTIGGGSGTYTYQLFNSSCASVFGPQSYTQQTTITNLPVDIGVNTCYPIGGSGYTLVVTDSAGSVTYINNLVINGATPLVINPVKTDILCFGETTGTININPSGGQLPYNALTTTVDGFSSASLNLTNLSAGTYNIQVTDQFGTLATSSVTLLTLNPLISIDKPEDEIVVKQCDPNFHYIRFKVTSTWASSTVYLDYNTDNNEDINGNLIWTPITVNGYVDSNTILTIQVPVGTFTENYTIRMKNAAGTCYSEELFYDFVEVATPPVQLSINVDNPTVDNDSIQTSQSIVKFRFNVSHLLLGYTLRAPYVVNYSVTGYRNFDSATVTPSPTIISNNQQIIQSNVPQVNGLPATSCEVTVKITDNVGCESNIITIPINLI
jgi:hypothetical protein